MSEAARDSILDRSQALSLTYSSPPLVEVAMSVQFDPPKGMNLGHLGAFWVTQKELLPSVRVANPIAAAREDFGEQTQWRPPPLQFALSSKPDCRLQMTSADDQWVGQVQRDRLVVNWRKRTGEYPSFTATWIRFQQTWQSWEDFLSEFEFASLRPWLWELTYVNRITSGTLWKSPNDWPRLFPGLWGSDFAAGSGIGLRGFQGQWIGASADPVARLYLDVKLGQSSDELQQDTLILTLTARGPIVAPENRAAGHDSSEANSIEHGMNWGHDLIVSTFDRISSELAKNTWGREC